MSLYPTTAAVAAAATSAAATSAAAAFAVSFYDAECETCDF